MQITLTPAGMAAANAASTSGLKIEITKFRVYRSNRPEANLPYVTTGLEDLTTLSGWTWLPNGVEFTTVEEFEPLDPDTVQFLCRLDETVGDFDFDILTLWLADGTFFGLAANPFLWKKRQAGNPPANQIKIHVSFTFTNAAATTAININNSKYSFDFIPEVNSVDELPLAESAPHRMYRVTRVIGIGGAPSRGVRSYLVQSGKAFFDPQTYQHNEWIPSDHRMVFQPHILPWVQNHASSASFQNTPSRVVVQFSSEDTTDLGQINRLYDKSMLLGFFQSNSGLLRQVDWFALLVDGSGIWVAFSLATPLPVVASIGDTIKVYTSQMDYQLISPSAANQVLMSKAQTLGFGQNWVDISAIVPTPPASGLVLTSDDSSPGAYSWKPNGLPMGASTEIIANGDVNDSYTDFVLPPKATMRILIIAGGGGGGSQTANVRGNGPHEATNGSESRVEDITPYPGAAIRIATAPGGGRGENSEMEYGDYFNYDNYVAPPIGYFPTVSDAVAAYVTPLIVAKGEVNGESNSHKIASHPNGAVGKGFGAAGLPGYTNVSASANGASGSAICFLYRNPYNEPRTIRVTAGKAGKSAGRFITADYGTNTNPAGAGYAYVVMP